MGIFRFLYFLQVFAPEPDYTYDGSGNIKEEKIGQSITGFTYDENSQLIREELPDGTINQYEYDDAGNRKTSIRGDKTDVFTFNEANQIATKNDIAYQYDTDGNLLQDEHFKYEYNAFGYQTRVTDLQGNEVARYEYDETGLRTKKIVGSQTHEYYYDGDQLSLEIIRINDSIEQYRNYQWEKYTPLGMVIREKDESNNWKEQVYHYWTNQRGDVVSIRDNDGKEVGSYTYDAYGNVLTEVGKVAQANPIRYAGYYFDEETKNYYLQARYYNPANGAFLALDPDSGDNDDPSTQNGYGYTSNNPLKYVDYNGERKYGFLLTFGETAGKWVVKKGKKVWQSGKKVVRKIKTSFVIPKEATNTLKYVKKNGHPKQGYKGGGVYKNSNELLPTNTKYKEYDIFPKKKGENRGAERIVIGENGKAYYTNNHYKTFRTMN
uniref:RHS repeat-associated core domain-containing protein n=1 Tax=Peribacillus asahii TaxID=228899 RepID=UPI0027D9041F|nr:ribonuclease domain-containing protein [Peribacillus asahii]